MNQRKTVATASTSSVLSTSTPTGGAGGTGPADLYLGLLFAVEDYKIYGYITNSRIKLIVIIHGPMADPNVKLWLKEVHNMYVALVCNPFSQINSKIEWKTFDEQIAKHVKLYNDKHPQPSSSLPAR